MKTSRHTVSSGSNRAVDVHVVLLDVGVWASVFSELNSSQSRQINRAGRHRVASKRGGLYRGFHVGIRTAGCRSVAPIRRSVH